MKTYTLQNSFLELSVLDFGATITSLKYQGKEMVLRHDDLNEYINEPSFLCKTVGRYGNRIGGARFTLNGTEYVLAPNEGRNQLHGGPEAFSDRMWEAEADSEHIKMTIFSPDGDNGFPGNLTMTVTFTLKGHALHVDFEGECDADTVFSPTIHPYFVADNPRLELNCPEHIEVDDELIPTGNILKCEGRYDFSKIRELKNDLDDAFVSPNEYALTYENDGVTLEVWTDFPAVQVFSGHEGGVAIEPEYYPDSPNHKNFPDTTLHPGEKFKKYCEYKFY